MAGQEGHVSSIQKLKAHTNDAIYLLYYTRSNPVRPIFSAFARGFN